MGHRLAAAVIALDAVILAGGASRRMGTDKATLEVGGQRLVDRVAGRLAGLGGDILVAVGARDLPGVRTVRDVADVSGPLGGVLAGLAAVHTPVVALVAVDAPYASATVLRRLGEACTRAGRPAAVPVVDGVPQPLHAVVRRDAEGAIEQLARAGHRSVRGVLGLLDALAVGPDGWVDLDATGRFATDWDVPADIPAGVGRGSA